MDNLARDLFGQDAHIETATCTRVLGHEIQVTVAGGTRRASRATSCLVSPEVDDLLLVCSLPTGACFVLAVLHRKSTAIRLAPPGDVELALEHGTLRMSAADGVSLASPRDVGIRASELDVQAADAKVAVGSLAYIGRKLETHVAELRTVAERVEVVAASVMQSVKRAFRFVEELDLKRVARLDHRAEHEWRLHAENAVLTAAELVKLNGQQIHLG